MPLLILSPYHLVILSTALSNTIAASGCGTSWRADQPPDQQHAGSWRDQRQRGEPGHTIRFVQPDQSARNIDIRRRDQRQRQQAHGGATPTWSIEQLAQQQAKWQEQQHEGVLPGERRDQQRL